MIAAWKTFGNTMIKSLPSRNHTELMLKSFNYPIRIQKKGQIDKIFIDGLKQFKSFEYKVPGDISSASFFIVLTLLSKKSKIVIEGVNVNKSRVGIIQILNKMGAKIKVKNKKFYIQSGAGIVADSVPEKEYLETVNKAKALIKSLNWKWKYYL